MKTSPAKLSPSQSTSTPTAVIITQLSQNPIFAKSSAHGLEMLAAHAEIINFRPNRKILNDGERSEEVYVLLSGVAGVFYTTNQGETILVKLFKAPAVFGEIELFAQLPRLETVESISKTQLARVPEEVFRNFLLFEPACCFALLQDVSHRFCIAATHERSLAFADIESRLAGLLLDFIDAFGLKTSAGLCIDYKLSYMRLAQCLGVTTRSVERIMARWFEEAWITRDNGRYCLQTTKQLVDKMSAGRLSLFYSLTSQK